MKHYTDEERTRVIEAVKAGMKVSQAVKEFGVSRATIDYWVSKTPKRKRTKPTFLSVKIPPQAAPQGRVMFFMGAPHDVVSVIEGLRGGM